MADIRKKWHIPPAFSVEFIGYYLDRSIRLNEMKDNLQKQLSANKILVGQQQTLRDKYEDVREFFLKRWVFIRFFKILGG